MEKGQPHHIEYYVNDLAATKKFWVWFGEQINYKLYQEFGDGFSLRHPSGTYLVFVQVAKDFLAHGNNRQASGLNHLAFMGSTAEELDQLEIDLKSHGAKVIKKTNDYLLFEELNQFAIEVYA